MNGACAVRLEPWATSSPRLLFARMNGAHEGAVPDRSDGAPPGSRGADPLRPKADVVRVTKQVFDAQKQAVAARHKIQIAVQPTEKSDDFSRQEARN